MSAVVPLFTDVSSLVFIGTVLPASANYTVEAIGMIAVMTGWLPKVFRAADTHVCDRFGMTPPGVFFSD